LEFQTIHVLESAGINREYPMATVTEHYENLLADYYSWMFGDFTAKVAANREFFIAQGMVPQRSGGAVDLGAGSAGSCARAATASCDYRRSG
jgi:hypothetical protein